ncbi:MAG: TlpA family protein disulfide reductase [Anaerolineae bacterium]|nr:TlpA family protein disulfide reductase [Anaerolineae bacterium]
MHPCRIEMPELQALHTAHPDVRVLAVNLGESRNLIVDWAAQLRLTFDIVLDADQAIASRYRLRGQPSTYVVSPGGVITNIFYGPTTRQTLEGALEPFLRES